MADTMSMKQSNTRARGVLRNGSVKGQTTPNPPRTTLKNIGQGIRQIHPKSDKKGDDANIDIVFVPGLGCNPETDWRSEQTPGLGSTQPIDETTGKPAHFNWMLDDDGLIKEFPKARILLYMYESAFYGSLKIPYQNLNNLGEGLLSALADRRQNLERPIVFIGHSMGGLVIAKAVTMAETEKSRFPTIIESIGGCVFFGTPFGGADVANFAHVFSNIMEKVKNGYNSKLVDMMRPGDQYLGELRRNFARIAARDAPMGIYCFWEEQDTPLAKKYGLSLVTTKFVTQDSATLDNTDGNMGLACDHRDLVRFRDSKDSRWGKVRYQLKSVINGAHGVAKRRQNSTRGVDQFLINGIYRALEGTSMTATREGLRKKFPDRSWISSEEEFQKWLDGGSTNNGPELHPGACIWIRGRQGRGKTNAAISALDSIEQLRDKRPSGTPDSVALGYFFCLEENGCTAEDLLKSLVLQLVGQKPALASHAKQFVKNNEELYKFSQPTVENLWQAILGMIEDEAMSKTVYFVLSNLHILHDDSSTRSLMNLLHLEVKGLTKGRKRTTARWLITSRDTSELRTTLGAEAVHLLDLSNEDLYHDELRAELRKHAKRSIEGLELDRKYNKALAYFASSLIGKRAEYRQWIDITCVRLQQLPETSDLKVRQLLDAIPKDINVLLDRAWRHIFDSNEADAEKIKEILRTLIITYQPPTEKDTVVLSGLGLGYEDDHEERDRTEDDANLIIDLRRLIKKCEPLLRITRTGEPGSEGSGTVQFMDEIVKSHLLKNSGSLLGRAGEEIKLQHDIIALRSFLYLKKQFDHPAADGESVDEDDDAAEDYEDETADNDDAETIENYENEAVENDKDYMVEYWLRHASEATHDFAEDLSVGLDSDFWQPGSLMRRRWLKEYDRITDAMGDFFETVDEDSDGEESGDETYNDEAVDDELDEFEEFLASWTGLHVAAAFGYEGLVEALIREGHKPDIHTHDTFGSTPLHLASNFGHLEIVDLLLRHDAKVSDGAEYKKQTPLHLAAEKGHERVMKMLIDNRADPDEYASDVGPVINSAISSGNLDAVRLLVEKNVTMYVDTDEVWSPLEGAAACSDAYMVSFLLETWAGKLPDSEYGKALVGAAEYGKGENFKLLFESHEHDQEYLQKAMDAASEEENWDIVKELMRKCRRLNCDMTFFHAATGAEEMVEVLGEVWDYSRKNTPVSEEKLNESLYVATDREKTETVKLLLKGFDANPNATGPNYGNALTASAFDGTTEIMQLLLDAKANVNSPDGWALQAAATEGHKEVVEMLLKMNADVNACVENENFPSGTAIQGACESGNIEIVSLLLNKGANPNLGRGVESPPIISATSGGDEAMVKMLLKAGANVNVRGGYQNATPLIYASQNLPQESLHLILQAGADVNMTGEDGNTALIMAAAEDNPDATSFLLNHGADIMHRNQKGQNALQAAMESDARSSTSILVHRVSELLRALDDSVANGNTFVADIVRQALGDTSQAKSLDSRSPSSIQESHLESHELYSSGHERSASNTYGHLDSNSSRGGERVITQAVDTYLEKTDLAFETSSAAASAPSNVQPYNPGWVADDFLPMPSPSTDQISAIPSELQHGSDALNFRGEGGQTISEARKIVAPTNQYDAELFLRQTPTTTPIRRRPAPASSFSTLQSHYSQSSKATTRSSGRSDSSSEIPYSQDDAQNESSNAMDASTGYLPTPPETPPFSIPEFLPLRQTAPTSTAYHTPQPYRGPPPPVGMGQYVSPSRQQDYSRGTRNEPRSTPPQQSRVSDPSYGSQSSGQMDYDQSVERQGSWPNTQRFVAQRLDQSSTRPQVSRTSSPYGRDQAGWAQPRYDADPRLQLMNQGSNLLGAQRRL